MRRTPEQIAAARGTAMKNARYADGVTVSRHDEVKMASPHALGGTGLRAFGWVVGGAADGVSVIVEPIGGGIADTYKPTALLRA